MSAPPPGNLTSHTSDSAATPGVVPPFRQNRMWVDPPLYLTGLLSYGLKTNLYDQKSHEWYPLEISLKWHSAATPGAPPPHNSVET